MPAALERHGEILRAAIERHDGYVFATTGDGLAAAFHEARDAVGAAADAQRALATGRDPDVLGLAVRMGLHTGEASERDGVYFGPVLNRAARIMAVGHGGQILLGAVADPDERPAPECASTSGPQEVGVQRPGRLARGDADLLA
jgi:class 3 adenylate cyclase